MLQKVVWRPEKSAWDDIRVLIPSSIPTALNASTNVPTAQSYRPENADPLTEIASTTDVSPTAQSGTAVS